MAITDNSYKISLVLASCLGYNLRSITKLSQNMDINILVQCLQHGESYTVHNAEGEPYQETRPPTALTIRAARAIVALANQTQQSNEIILNLQRQLNEIVEQYELLQKANLTPKPSE